MVAFEAARGSLTMHGKTERQPGGEQITITLGGILAFSKRTLLILSLPFSIVQALNLRLPDFSQKEFCVRTRLNNSIDARSLSHHSHS